MTTQDAVRFAYTAIARARVRTALILLAMAIAVASVILLTGVAEAARKYVVNEFASMGTNLVFVMPGKAETTGGTINASVGKTTRPLRIADAEAITKHYEITHVVPVVTGLAGVNRGGLERETEVMGASSAMLPLRQWQMQHGQFLPDTNWSRATPVCVIGVKIQSELFGRQSAVGRWLRIGQHRFRVIGVLADTDNSIGQNVNELVIIPVASAMMVFNTENLYRIFVSTRSSSANDTVTEFIKKTIKARHHGEEDITVITQDAMVDTFNSIFYAFTATVAGIAAISLAVAGVLIMNIMLVAVSQRTGEVGLLKSVGAAPGQITALFLTEAALLSLLGATIGVVTGFLGGYLLQLFYPQLDMRPQLWAVLAAVGTAMATGVLFGYLPARRAASLDAIAALSGRY
jgi:putative ABC transport system permease protein